MIAALALCNGATAPAIAQNTALPDPDAAIVPAAPNAGAASDWKIGLGAALAVSPVFLGSKDYSLKAAPSIDVRYKDIVFFSPFEGSGVNLIRSRHFRAGPLISFDPGRKQSGKSLFQIAGLRDTSLLGLGDVKATVAAGGFAEYTLAHFSARLRATKAIGGDNGIIGDISARYTAPIVTAGGHVVLFSIGPRATIVNTRYNNAYFGVTALQSANSGLSPYSAKGGLQSCGLGSALVLPLSKAFSATLATNYDRLSGDAASAPLVVQRGSANRASAVLAFVYRFGL
jgi:outer membrane scaffolding protein for murein synthesis (MipA/OmpV family)